jgi:diphthine synthase
MGLSDEKDMSLKAIEAARECDLLFAEFYTQKMNTTKTKLEKLVGKEIKLLSRREVEESNILIKEARSKKVGLLVGGDAFCATTHLVLKCEAEKNGIETRVIHGSSIFSAVAETGLHIYKFGQTVTIPFLEKLKNELPVSVYEKVNENKKMGLHTLILLDIVEEEKRYMNVNEACEILLKLEKKMKQKLFDEDTEIVVFSRAGSKDSRIFYGKLSQAMNANFGEPPFCIILPGHLHFTEKECLEMFRDDKG